MIAVLYKNECITTTRFKKNDIFYNRIKTHPRINFIVYSGSVYYNNKNLAVIGTGASAMQAAPELAKCAKKLTIFQRTPHWVLANPNYHRKLSEGKKWTLENLPFYSTFLLLYFLCVHHEIKSKFTL